MKIATFNANSIRARLPIVTDWIEKEEPDVLFVQETKVQDKDFPQTAFHEMGYHVVCRGQKSYNGVATITKYPLGAVWDHLTGGEDEEARFLSVELNHIPMINVYAPQGFAPGTEKFDYKIKWLRDLLTYLKGHFDPGGPLLIAGDFNVALGSIDVYDPDGLRGEVGFHPKEQEIMEEILSWGLVDIFRKHRSEGGHYTFWDYRIPNAFRRGLGWRIDYILSTVSLAECSFDCWIDTEPRLLKKPSDHTFLVAQFSSDGS
jgi:exodeoxyribonuclease-3